jgi:hypothetical protein
MEANFVIMGLPASGKTTFLAALWHLVESDETDCRLRLDRYEGDLVYLNQIAEAWRTFQKVPRTSQVGNVDITIHLVDRETKVKAAAFFPDLAGETFDAQVEARRCRLEFVDGVADDRGILFFISADVKGDVLSVVELNAIMPPSGDEGGANVTAAQTDARANASPAGSPDRDEAEVPTPAPSEWEPKLVPAQVRIVQLLSDLQRAPFEPRRRRLAVMISAWDLTRASGLGAAEWLAAKMPLLDQFLRANRQVFEHRIYGVSAQGVRLDDDVAVSKAAKLTPSRRIEIVGPDGAGHDLTLPLVWLMSAE